MLRGQIENHASNMFPARLRARFVFCLARLLASLLELTDNKEAAGASTDSQVSISLLLKLVVLCTP